MVVVSPDKIDGLNTIETSLTPKVLRKWQKSMVKEDVGILMPKFKLEQGFRLSEKLSEMGMPDLFGTDADLSGMTGSRDLHVDALVHKAFVEFNEKGTEAAAATAGLILLGGPTHEFAADHPFLFFIKDNETNSILFMGRLVRPEGTTTAKDEL